MSAPAEPPIEAAFFIGLYRREKAAAIARGVDLTAKHHHDFTLSSESGYALTFHPAARIGDGNDGCFIVRVW